MSRPTRMVAGTVADKIQEQPNEFSETIVQRKQCKPDEPSEPKFENLGSLPIGNAGPML